MRYTFVEPRPNSERLNFLNKHLGELIIYFVAGVSAGSPTLTY